MGRRRTQRNSPSAPPHGSATTLSTRGLLLDPLGRAVEALGPGQGAARGALRVGGHGGLHVVQGDLVERAGERAELEAPEAVGDDRQELRVLDAVDAVLADGPVLEVDGHQGVALTVDDLVLVTGATRVGVGLVQAIDREVTALVDDAWGRGGTGHGSYLDGVFSALSGPSKHHGNRVALSGPFLRSSALSGLLP